MYLSVFMRYLTLLLLLFSRFFCSSASITLTILRTALPVLFRLLDFFRRGLRPWRLEIADEPKDDFNLHVALAIDFLWRVDNDSVHKVIDHRRSQFLHISVFSSQRHECFHVLRAGLIGIQAGLFGLNRFV